MTVERRVLVFLVRSREAGTEILLVCSLCKQRVSLATGWLAFPSNATGQVEGKWVHEACGRGALMSLFGQGRAVLMRGTDALQNMARNLAEAPS
jgi:hypothetical protein